MSKIHIAAVSYINTFPFIYGIEKSGYLTGKYKLHIENPSKCAQYLIENKVDIGLVPVAIMNELPYKDIVSSYCIGAIGEVKSVVLLSNSNLNDIKKIFLDYQSRTSVMLVKILAKFFWDIDVLWENTKTGFENDKLKESEGAIIIGDRVFGQLNKFKYRYDLALEWKKFTGLPFIFAAWIANKPLPENFKNLFNKSLAYGINHIPDAIKTYATKKYAIDLEDYLYENIDYNLNTDKIQGMNKFLEYLDLINKE